MSDETNATAATGESTATSFKLSDIERRYFSPSEMEAAETYLAKIAEAEGVHFDGPNKNVKMNHDITSGLPDGYGVAIIPINKRGKDENGDAATITTGVSVFAVPDFTTIAATERGQDFIRTVVMDNCMAKAANSVRPRTVGAAPVTMPFTLEDFIESRRGGSSLKTFTEIAPAFVKHLKQRGATHMTSQLLRKTLASSAFAEQQFPNVSQDFWNGVIDAMVAQAGKKGLDAAILHSWKNTRAEAGVDELELDLDDLDGLLDD